MSKIETPDYERLPTKPEKTYGLMCVVPTRSEATKIETEKQVLSWPEGMLRELLLFVVLLVVLSTIALLFNAPLEEPANALHPPNPAKAPWYFLGLQEMVSYSAFWGGVGIPGIALLVAAAAPYLEWRPGGEGVWFHKSRSAANWIFMGVAGCFIYLTIVGTFFRGENWALVIPW